MVRRRSILSAVLAGILLAAQAVDAAEVRITAQIGFAGYTAPGRWAPLFISLTGLPDDDFAVEVQRAGTAVREIFTRRIAGDPERIECPVYINRNAADRFVSIKLTAGGRVLAEQTIDTGRRLFPGHLVLAVGVPAAVRQAAGRALLPAEPVAVVEIAPDELPKMGLSYDGVSGIVMRDPGHVLNPAQIRALRSWLAGGGRLVIGDLLPAAQSIVPVLNAAELPSGAGDFIQIGLGGIVLTDQAETHRADAETAGYWRDMLGLDLYVRETRLTAGRCFPYESGAASPAPYPSAAIWLVMAGWAGVMVGTAVLVSRRRIAALAVVSVMATIAALPLGSAFDRQWRRGATITTRAVILPAGGGVLTATTISLPGLRASDTDERRSSPWGIKAVLLREEGELSPLAERAVWRHNTVPAVYTVWDGDEKGVRLAGCLPPVEPDLERIFNASGAESALTDRFAFWDGQVFVVPQMEAGSGRIWRQFGDRPPDWLAQEKNWLNALAAAAPGGQWLFGRGPLPVLPLQVQGGSADETIWALPLLAEVHP